MTLPSLDCQVWDSSLHGTSHGPKVLYYDKVNPARDIACVVDIRSAKRKSGIVTPVLGASDFLWIGVIMTSFVSSSSLTPAKAGRRDDRLIDALQLESAGVGSWRVCDGRVACGEGRFLAFIDEKDDEFEVMEFTDEFVWTTFATMDDAFAHVAQTTGASPATEAKAWNR